MDHIAMGMALYPNFVRAWAVLVVIDMMLFVLIFFLPDEGGEEQGNESGSAVGVIDQLEVSRGRAPPIESGSRVEW